MVGWHIKSLDRDKEVKEFMTGGINKNRVHMGGEDLIYQPMLKNESHAVHLISD